MLVELVLLLVVLAAAYHHWARGYWKRKNVFSVDGDILFGSTRRIYYDKKDPQPLFDELYRQHKEKKLIGLYNFYEPILLVTDVDLIKQVFVTDFNSFPRAVFFVTDKTDPMIKMNPFFSSGEEWKARRGMHVALMTQAKLKENTHLITKIGQTMVKYLKETKSSPVKVRDVVQLYTIDNITSIMFGCEPTAFSDPENGFRKCANQNFLAPGFDSSAFYGLFLSSLGSLFESRFFSVETQEFFMEMAKQLYGHRKENKLSRNDLIDHLVKIEEKMKSEGKKGWEPAEIAGHMMTLYIDSTETSSNMLCFLFLELANRPEVQEKLRAEIVAAGKNLEDFDYEKVNSLSYLNMVFNEIMRLHPVANYLTRMCSQNTSLGGVAIDAGTKVFIPYQNIVNDPDFYPDPDKFEPERFAPDNAENIKGKFFPFGEGPKQCLGMRYAILQIKLATIFLLLKFKLIPVNSTGDKIKLSKSLTFLNKPAEEEEIIFQSLEDAQLF